MDRYLDWLAEVADRIKPSIRVEDCSDFDDNRFLELLLAGKGDVLISGDRDLLRLHAFEGAADHHAG